MFERLSLRIEPGKVRQETRMNIQYPPAKRLDKTRRQQPHISSKTNKIHVVLAQGCDNLALVLFTITPATLDRNSFNSTLSGELQPTRAGFVTDHNRDLSVRYHTVANRITERQHV
jgi:hypothetical protein